MLAFHLKATVLATACLMLASQSAGYTMQEMCAQWSGSGYIGNPADCNSWGYCKGQQLIGYGTCDKDLVYDSLTQTCQPASTTKCSTSAQKTCSALKTAGFVADPNDCSKYTYCFGDGTSKTVSCPAGQTYAANNNSCVWGPTCPQNSICRFMPDNIFVGDPNNCGQFLHCVNGYGKWGKCTKGQYNAATGYCQESYSCSDDDTSNNSNNNGNPNLPPSKITNCTDTQDFIADGATCYGYYFCNKTTNGVWGSCPLGLEFNAATEKCVSPASLSCTGNRCANTNLTYAVVADTNCTEYTYCPTGAKSYCNPEYPYLDEISGQCVPKKPKYPVCGPQET
ncbi:PREDICTED: peritrophin-44 isoform X2 [Drosophila arizonae]|uniref:Peritrophin-44 isoform X2 n=1 Tax=Drosophila arizonae TaxID=7263 RepID=A0ABM1P3T1_DROAR|nr:PREDICTED: peritrophin-44 isoform X2 [Drosophila arizonae]